MTTYRFFSSIPPKVLDPVLAILCGVLVWLSLPIVAYAEGPTVGGTRVYLADAPFGEFTVNSFAAPNPPVTTDRLWITVEIRDEGRAVSDARVWVTVSDLSRDYSQRVEATHDIAPTAYDYTAAIPVPEESSYDVRIEMEHPTGNAETQYSVKVATPLTNSIFLFMLGPALLIVAFLIHRFVVRLPAPVAVLAGDDAPLNTDPNEPV
jgi:hypothetical protein